MKPDRHSQRLGWTLLEVLLAVVIAALILAVVLGVHQTVGAVVLSRSLAAGRRADLMRAGTRVVQDLVCMTAGLGEECTVKLAPSESLGTNACYLRLCAVDWPEHELDGRWATVYQVQYFVSNRSLHRCERELTGPGFDRPRTNEILRNIEAFRVEFFDGGQWHSEWGGEALTGMPRAARVEIVCPRLDPWTTWTWIPAGTPWTSRVERAP